MEMQSIMKECYARQNKFTENRDKLDIIAQSRNVRCRANQSFM